MVPGHEVYDEQKVGVEPGGDAEARNESGERMRNAFLKARS